MDTIAYEQKKKNFLRIIFWGLEPKTVAVRRLIRHSKTIVSAVKKLSHIQSLISRDWGVWSPQKRNDHFRSLSTTSGF